MKKKIIAFIGCLTVIAVLHSLAAKAQTNKPLPCREPKVSKEAIQKLIQARSNKQSQRSQNSAASTQQQLRVFFHICTNDSGTEPGATEAEVKTEFQTLLNDYAGGDVCFVYAGLNYIANTTLNHIDLDDNGNAEDLFEARTISGCLNVFYTNEIRGTNGSNGGRIGGYAFNIPGTFCLVANGNLGGNSTSHEIGHCLGLFHTFSTKGLGEEYIDGTGCSIRGDLMCDTPADPYAYNEEDCFSSGNGVYTGNCEDPDGKKNFHPPYNNIMSYWHRDPEVFTGDQYGAVNYTIEDESAIQNTASASNYSLFNSSYNFGFIYKSAVNDFTTAGSVEFSGAVQAGLFGKTVKLLPGFHAHPQVLSVTIRATDCSVNGGGANFITQPVTAKSPPVKAEQITPGSGMTIYPNPASNFFNIQYSESSPFNAFITIRSSNGSVMFTIRKNNVMQLQEKINMSGKAKGLYFVELQAGTRRLTGKVILQ